MDKPTQDSDPTPAQATSSAADPVPQGPSGGESGRGRRGGRRRSAYATRDLTTGSIPRTLAFIAWPQVVEGFLRVADQLADLVWAGFLGTRSIAGLGVAQQYTQMAFTGRQGIDISQRAMISRAIGMGDEALANHVLMQAWTMTLVFGSVMVMIGVFFTEPMLRVLGVSDAVVAEAAPYMRLYFIGHMTTAFQQVSGHALGAAGDTLTLMKSTTVARVIHLVLSPLLVFGLVGLPEMGLAGAALANIVAHAISVTLLLRVLFRGTSRLHPRLREYRFDGPLLWKLTKVGVPAALNGVERSAAQLIMIPFVTPFGDVSLAAYTVTRRMQMFANLGSQGMGMASGVLVGQGLGAGKPERAKETIYWATGYVLVVNGIMSILLFMFPSLVLSIFNRDPAFLEVAQVWVRIMALGWLTMGMGQVFQNSFQMAGDTLAPLLITLLSLWGIGIPLAYALSHYTSLGQYGIAWAVVISMVIRALAYIPYFYWGRWLRIAMFTQRSWATAASGACDSATPPKTDD